MSTDNPDHREDEHAVFSRTGMVAPMGTLIDPLKTFVDPDTAAAFRKKVAAADTDVSGALRDWVYLTVHGKTYRQICAEASESTRQALFGEVPIQALSVRGEVKS